MESRNVYLCGPITGTSYDECTGWRLQAAEKINEAGFEAIDPMRGKAFLKREKSIKDSYEDYNDTGKHQIYKRDHYNCINSGIILCNLLGAKKVSIGSMFELAWADAADNFIVVVMEKEGNPHTHAFVREAAGIVYDNLDDAIDYIITTFGKKRS